MKWNSPFYGVEEGIWFLSYHCFTNYVKVALFCGALLRPIRPARRSRRTCYLDIRNDDSLDEAQFTAWVKQASELPGERM